MQNIVMKLLIEIKGKPKKGDILVFDGECYEGKSIQTIAHELYQAVEELRKADEEANGRIDKAKEAIISANGKISVLAKAIKEGN